MAAKKKSRASRVVRLRPLVMEAEKQLKQIKRAGKKFQKEGADIEKLGGMRKYMTWQRKLEVAEDRVASLKGLVKDMKLLVRDALRAEKGGSNAMYLRNGEWLRTFGECITLCKAMGVALPRGVPMSRWTIK